MATDDVVDVDANDTTLMEEKSESSESSIIAASQNLLVTTDLQFRPLTASTQITQFGHNGQEADKITIIRDNLDITQVWSPTEESSAPASRAKSKGEDPLSRFDSAIESANLHNKDEVKNYCARVYDLHHTQVKTAAKGPNDIMKVSIALGTVVDQLGLVSHGIHKNTMEIDSLSTEVRRVAEYASELGSKMTELIDHFNRHVQSTASDRGNHLNLVKTANDAWNRTDSLSKRVTDLDVKLMAATSRGVANQREVERLSADLFRSTNEFRLGSQRVEERVRTAQTDMESLRARMGSEIDEALKRNESRMSTSLPPTPASTVPSSSWSAPAPSPIPNATPQGPRQTEYMCSSCNVVYTSNKEYQLHLKKMHKDPVTNPFPCNSCMRRFADQQGLVTHMLAKHNITPTIMPAAEATRDAHLAYLVPNVCISKAQNGDVVAEEGRQVLAKIQEVRADIQWPHIKSTKRLTEGKNIPLGSPYTVLVIFHDPATRALLHEANVVKGWPLKPFLDLQQLQDAKKQAALGMLPFLSSGAAAETPVGGGVSTTLGHVATNVQQQRPLPNQGEIPYHWGNLPVPPPAASVSITTPQMQQPHMSTTTSVITPIQAIRPFLQQPPPPVQSRQRGRGRGAGAPGKGQQ